MRFHFFARVVELGYGAATANANLPWKLHSDNPHYLHFRGKPQFSSPPANTTALCTTPRLDRDV
jgi:hypothetical protein